jgi:hypothetical protein
MYVLLRDKMAHAPANTAWHHLGVIALGKSVHQACAAASWTRPAVDAVFVYVL